MKNQHKARDITVLSDSTGELGERIIRALVSQFPKGRLTFRVVSFVTESKVEKIFESIEADPILFHTTISDKLKKAIENQARRRKWPVFDLTGGAMQFLEAAVGLKATPSAAMLHELNEEYEQRIAALNFTVEHDDGLGEATWKEADILLLGVSRTSKTPTSIFLANKGFKVANVPLVKGIQLPENFARAARRKAVGLLVQPEKLQDIRLKRAEAEKIPGKSYTDLNDIKDELTYAHNLFLELGVPVVDVTNRAVEETATLILTALGRR